MKTELYLYDGPQLKGKFTAEESGDGAFIATKWIPEEYSEMHRDVGVFETKASALAAMYEQALNFSLRFTSLRAYGHRNKPQ